MISVAVLGAGRMGTAITRRLTTRGHNVTVWNRSGVHTATSPADAVRDAQVVIVMVTDAAAVDEVLTRAAPALQPGSVVLQMSTISPDEVRALAARCPVPLLDAPVKGSVPAAESGSLTILLGAGGSGSSGLGSSGLGSSGLGEGVDGPSAGGEGRVGSGGAEEWGAVTAVLAELGEVRRCGGVGAGSAVKLVLNAALVTGIAALADVMALAAAVGVDRETAWDVVGSSALAAAVPRALATGADFPLALAAKDTGLALTELPSAPLLAATAHVLRATRNPTADIATLITPDRATSHATTATTIAANSAAITAGDIEETE
ncbi:hypothetical protein GCM10010435_28580 [Winogradskya consettensis]|uniref:3-hydroxyisobutyrate dehydrogenase n=1 Tax=Winogradskya consettensis TaxID=113560 RepID=A0A919SFX4_9ACTN|nr:NAD(P)-binding domain-containing protein [Actinoplanes consettensis]GIM70939.1 hypothetical protein Aco04nite_22930 [Actinoplanes consettensis]